MATVCNGVFASFDYPMESELFDDYIDNIDIFESWSEKPSTIEDDVAKIASRSRTMSSSYLDDTSDINNDNDVKPEMRFGDLMWPSYFTMNSVNNGSANNSSNNGISSNNSCTHNNNSNSNNINTTNSAASSYSESSAVPPAIVSGNPLMMIKTEIEDEDDNDHDNDNDNNDHDDENCNDNNNNANNKTNSNGNKLCTFATSARIAIRKPNNSSSNYNTNAKTVISNNAEEYIPPGASLLRKSQNNGNKSTNLESKSRYIKCHLQKLRSEMNEYANSVTSSNPSEFRHNVDLRACVMGSNNISLTNFADASYIDHISRELQNTSKNHIDMLPYVVNPVFNDVLDVISQQTATTNGPATTTGSATTTAASATEATTILDDDDLLSSGNSSSGVVGASLMTPPATNSECDSDDGDCSMVDSSCGSSDNGNIYATPYIRHHSDHSYTRNEMETNLETPSDSDEEIDVVSLNDKKLPTNPSDRDRRALQTKVANKISTLPPPRRGRYELPYTPASSSPVKSEANSRFPSPSSTPYQSTGAVSTVYSPFVSRNSSSGNSSSSSSSSAGSDCATTPSTQMQWESKSRKRFYVNDAQYRIYSIKGNNNKASSNSTSAATSAKKSRVKKVNTNGLVSGDFQAYPVSQVKQQQSTLGANNASSASSSGSSSASSSSNSMLKRQFSLDEADTIEKRNLHNDMERQRRIGLKNLFEALKKQIPNIRDKERAPKVNILREAAKLCEQLTSEERELSLKRQLLKARQKQLQELIARQRMSKNAAE